MYCMYVCTRARLVSFVFHITPFSNMPWTSAFLLCSFFKGEKYLVVDLFSLLCPHPILKYCDGNYSKIPCHTGRGRAGNFIFDQMSRFLISFFQCYGNIPQ